MIVMHSEHPYIKNNNIDILRPQLSGLKKNHICGFRDIPKKIFFFLFPPTLNVLSCERIIIKKNRSLALGTLPTNFTNNITVGKYVFFTKHFFL